MSIRDVVRSASIRIIGSAPESVFATDGQMQMEMTDLAQDAAEDIAASFDWSDLTRVATFTGDGATDAFPKPVDYDRMLVVADVDAAQSWLWGYRPFPSVSEYLRANDSGFGLVSPGGWIIIGGEFRFHPAPVGRTVFPYISRQIVRGEDGSQKERFDRDDDKFVLSERLLTLGLIWRYRAQKGLDYTEDMQTYNIALAQAQSRDAGAQEIRSRSHRRSGRFSTPYVGSAI